MNAPFPPPRLRTPALLLAGGLIVLAIGGATYGWSSIPDVAPVLIVAVAVTFILSRRDSDTGAALRRQLDERQAYVRLRVQALVGQVLSIAVAIGYTVAVATKTRLWPWAVLLGLMAVAFVAGRLMYGERGE